MRHVLLVVGGVPSRSLLHRLPIVFATVGCLTLLAGSAFSGQQAQQQPSAPRKTTAEDEIQSLRHRAEQEDARAQFRLGRSYGAGNGVPRDFAQAATRYRKAAEQGYAEAQLALGHLYLNGAGIPQDYGQAAASFRKAAEQGEAEAQAFLGVMYHEGSGVPQDYAQAVAWYRRAAEQGKPMAQNNLGGMYSEGLGVPQDVVEACKWMGLAAARLSGDQQKMNAEWRDALAQKMTPAQLAEAQKRASEWLAAFEKRKKKE
jgi:TPR repeat protein